MTSSPPPPPPPPPPLPPPTATTKPTLLALITAVDNVPLDFATNHDPYYTFHLAPDPRPHGFIHPNTVAKLPWPLPQFTVDHDSRAVTLNTPASSPSAFSASYANAAIQHVVDHAVATPSDFPTLNGLHSEPFRILGAPVRESPGDPSVVVQVERFAATLLGIATRGAHVTAYVPADLHNAAATTADDDEVTQQHHQHPRIWVARRSPHLHTYPSMLDSTVAGGVKATDSPLECAVAEADEEARLPPSWTRRSIRSTGAVTLSNANPRTGLFHSEVLYTYDLPMPPPPPPPSSSSQDPPSASTVMIPRPGSDGEVASFHLMTCADVLSRMRAGQFKPNVCAVMIDFMIRHGVVTPETEGEGAFAELCARLRRALPVPLTALGR